MDPVAKLIERAQVILGEPIGSPKYDLWKLDVARFVEGNFGSDLGKILSRKLTPNRMYTSKEEMRRGRNERIATVIELLEELKGRDAELDLSLSIPQTLQEAKRSVQQRFQGANITVSGNATFGDHSPLNQITVGEFMAALIDEVEKLPDTPEKMGLLKNLKAILENPTLASVAGGFVGGVVQGLVK